MMHKLSRTDDLNPTKIGDVDWVNIEPKLFKPSSPYKKRVEIFQLQTLLDGFWATYPETQFHRHLLLANVAIDSQNNSDTFLEFRRKPPFVSKIDEKKISC